MRQNIEVYIEELVLHGFSHSKRYRIGQALQLELTRLISEQGIPSTLSNECEYARINGGTINMSPVSKAEVIGNQVAQSIYMGL